MKTKREILEHIAKYGCCVGINCNTECPHAQSKHCPSAEFKKIGAMAILRMFRKKPTLDIGTKIKFENGEIGVLKKENNAYVIRFEHSVFYWEYLIGKTWEIVK